MIVDLGRPKPADAGGPQRADTPTAVLAHRRTVPAAWTTIASSAPRVVPDGCRVTDGGIVDSDTAVADEVQLWDDDVTLAGLRRHLVGARARRNSSSR